MTTGTGNWCICIAAILVIMTAGVSVSAAGQGKLAVPGLANAFCFGGDHDDQGNSIQETVDGNYILIGTTASANGNIAGYRGGWDIWVAKIDPNGQLVWKNCFGGSGDEDGYFIQQTADGGFIFIGQTSSNNEDVLGNHGGLDIWVVKLSQYGVVEWQKCLGGTLDDRGFSIHQTPDHGYILAGITYSNDNDVSGNHGNEDAWVVKLDYAGNIIWQKCIGGGWLDRGYSIQVTPDGGYILIGYTGSNDGDLLGISEKGTVDSWVVKMSENGNIQWQRRLGGAGLDAGFCIQLTADGGYILLGETVSSDGDVSGQHGPPGCLDIWVVKLDRTGAIQWQRCLGGSDHDNVDEKAGSIEQTTDGGYILTGYTRSNNGDVSGNHGGSDDWVVKLNTEGWPVWQRCLGGTADDSGSSIQETTDGGYILTGKTLSDNGEATGFHGASDVLFAKVYGPPILTGVAPAKVTAGTNPMLFITGDNLDQGYGLRVLFSKAGLSDIILPLTVSSADGKDQITCYPPSGTFVSPGVYSVTVITRDNQYATLHDAFTVTCGFPPTITSITPATAMQGASLSVVITGTKFWTLDGVTAYLNRTGQPNISIPIRWATATQLHDEYAFFIPAGAATGKWNLVVRNPDGQYAVKKDAFTVTLRTFRPPRVSSVSPKTVTSGSTVFINGISGNFFNASASVAMTGPRGVSIPVSNVSVLSDTKITCDANLTAIGKGYATVTVTNPDGKRSLRSRAFVIK